MQDRDALQAEVKCLGDELHEANIAYAEVAHTRGYGGQDANPEFFRRLDRCNILHYAFNEALEAYKVAVYGS